MRIICSTSCTNDNYNGDNDYMYMDIDLDWVELMLSRMRLFERIQEEFPEQERTLFEGMRFFCYDFDCCQYTDAIEELEDTGNEVFSGWYQIPDGLELREPEARIEYPSVDVDKRRLWLSVYMKHSPDKITGHSIYRSDLEELAEVWQTEGEKECLHQ